MNVIKTLLAGAVFALTASGANAAVVYADKVVSASYGTCSASSKLCTVNDRKNTNNALGATDGAFYSLGFGGSLVVGFAKSLFPAGSVSISEITFNRLVGHHEAVKVSTLDAMGNLVEILGTLTNDSGNGSLIAKQAFTYIRLDDVTKAVFPGTTSYDGYDVDSVSIAPVPLPAAGAMLLAGLGGFAALRRRRNSI